MRRPCLKEAEGGLRRRERMRRREKRGRSVRRKRKEGKKRKTGYLATVSIL